MLVLGRVQGVVLRHAQTTGMNLQVAATLSGALAWISDPVPGSRHDVAALDASGAMEGMDPADCFGDKGYVGRGMITPIKKPVHRDLLDWEKGFNTQINSIRAVIEQVIAHVKNWRILHTDYRRPLLNNPQTTPMWPQLNGLGLVGQDQF